MNETLSKLEIMVSGWPNRKLQAIWEAYFQASLASAQLTRQALIADVIWIESQRQRAA